MEICNFQFFFDAFWKVRLFTYYLFMAPELVFALSITYEEIFFDSF